MKLTAAQGTVLRDAALTAQGAVATATVALNTIGDAWTTAYNTLVGVMRELIKNLEGKLARNDPRWLAFGLNMPATSSTPGKPLNLTAHTDDTGAIVVQCDAVPLAARYRWRMLVVGVQTEYQLGGEHDGAAGFHQRCVGGADGADHRAGGEWEFARCGE